jgi:hypothetical protein
MKFTVPVKSIDVKLPGFLKYMKKRKKYPYTSCLCLFASNEVV